MHVAFMLWRPGVHRKKIRRGLLARKSTFARGQGSQQVLFLIALAFS